MALQSQADKVSLKKKSRLHIETKKLHCQCWRASSFLAAQLFEQRSFPNKRYSFPLQTFITFPKSLLFVS